MEPLIPTMWHDTAHNNDKRPFVRDGAHCCGECSMPLVMWPPADSEAAHGHTWRCENVPCQQRFTVMCDKDTPISLQLMWHATYEKKNVGIRNLMLPNWGDDREFEAREVCGLCGVKIITPEMVVFEHHVFICVECTTLCGLKDYTFPDHVVLDRTRLK